MKSCGHGAATHATGAHKHAFGFSQMNIHLGDQRATSEARQNMSLSEQAALHYVEENHLRRTSGLAPVSAERNHCRDAVGTSDLGSDNSKALSSLSTYCDSASPNPNPKFNGVRRNAGQRFSSASTLSLSLPTGVKAATSFLEGTSRADDLRAAIDRRMPQRVSHDPMSENSRGTFNSHLPPLLKSWRTCDERIRGGPMDRFKPPKKALAYRSYGTDGLRNCDGRLDAWGGATQLGGTMGSTRGAEAWLAGLRPLSGTMPPGPQGYRTGRLFDNLYLRTGELDKPGEAYVGPNQGRFNPSRMFKTGHITPTSGSYSGVKLRNSPCLDERSPLVYRRGPQKHPVDLVGEMVNPTGTGSLLATSKWRESDERAAEFDSIDVDRDGILDRGEMARYRAKLAAEGTQGTEHQPDAGAVYGFKMCAGKNSRSVINDFVKEHPSVAMASRKGAMAGKYHYRPRPTIGEYEAECQAKVRWQAGQVLPGTRLHRLALGPAKPLSQVFDAFIVPSAAGGSPFGIQ